MTTLRTLVKRPELDLRFVGVDGEERYGDQPVNGAVQLDEPLAELVRPRDAAADRGLLTALLVLVPPDVAAPYGGAGGAGPADELLGALAAMSAAGVILHSDVEPDNPSTIPWSDAAQRHGLALLAIPENKILPCPAIHAAILDEQRRESRRDLDFLREVQREAVRPGGLPRLLEQVSRLLDGNAVLVDASGRPLSAFPRAPAGLLTQVEDDVRRVATKRISSASVSLQGTAIHILPIDAGDAPAVLIVARAEPFTPQARRLVGDAARLIGMRRRLDELAERQDRLGRVDLRNREAVLHLLMTGHLSAARRAASALGPDLADVIEVHLVEGPREARDELVSRCVEATGDQAWIVRCPVYAHHVIVLAPVPPDQHRGDEDDLADRLSRVLREFAELHRDVYVGAGLPVPLAETGSGWEQAYHALAAARNSAEGFARFNPQASLAGLLGRGGEDWALATLRPLLDHRPDRPQDPGAAELADTLRSWLDFSSGAARHLKIHRNTLSSRLRRIEGLLGRDLADLVTQTELNLALRMLGRSGGRETAGGAALDDLLDADHVRHWAENQLQPFFEQDSLLLLNTVRCWLDNNANLKTAAMTLGISQPGLRKRLLRVEELIQRSLLGAPSVRYELWLALHVHDRSHR